jgi:hypothetical protein
LAKPRKRFGIGLLLLALGGAGGRDLCLCSHHNHHLHIPHNHHWHHRHHRHHFHLAAIVSTVTSAITSAATVVWNAVAGSLCSLGQAFMDSVVRSVVVGVMEIGKTVVLTAGKVIAMGIASIGSAIDSIFSVQRIYYAGSLAACLKGNFGTLEIDATVFSTKVAYARCSVPLATGTHSAACLARFSAHGFGSHRLVAISSFRCSLRSSHALRRFASLRLARSASSGHLTLMQLEGRVRRCRHVDGTCDSSQGCGYSGNRPFQVESSLRPGTAA